MYLEGDREAQKRYPRDLRPVVTNLLGSSTIRRFVMTYHFGKGRNHLYFCIDTPHLSECTLDAIMSAESLSPITDYIDQTVGPNNVQVTDYEHETKTSARAQLELHGLDNAADTFVNKIVETSIDNASRGSAAALRILSEGPETIGNWRSFINKVFTYCLPLNKGWLTSGADHFCFNSLGLDSQEEQVVTTMWSLFPDAHMMLRRLFQRESWSL